MPAKIFNVKDINLEQLKTLVPEILSECREQLECGGNFPKNLDYIQIKRVYREENGDIDECGGHYQLLTRIRGSDSRLNVSYITFGASPGLDIEIRAQFPCDVGEGWPLQVVEDNVQKILEDAGFAYELYEWKIPKGRFIQESKLVRKYP